VTLVVAVVFLLLFVEQSQSLLRLNSWPTESWRKLCENDRCLRVVSLNCGDGGIRSLREVTDWKPDLVLLQESPSEESVRDVAWELYGDEAFVLYHWNSSMIGRGRLQDRTSDESAHFVHGRVILSEGAQLDVVSVRLSAPVSQLDFWTSNFWQAHRDRRIDHRNEIEELLVHLENRANSLPTIVGGDFNAPPYDAALWPLQERFQETFSEAGRGWGGTGSNEYPLFRVDQIWVSESVRVGVTFSRKTVHSDHRMVVCDLLFAEECTRQMAQTDFLMSYLCSIRGLGQQPGERPVEESGGVVILAGDQLAVHQNIVGGRAGISDRA
jgi:endonuclease/exonuclease/phosphatase family metal-dependent hydrolase